MYGCFKKWKPFHTDLNKGGKNVKTRKYRVLSILLSLCMTLTLVPGGMLATTALAASSGISDYQSYEESGNLLTFQCGSEELKVELCTARMARIQLSVD